METPILKFARTVAEITCATTVYALPKKFMNTELDANVRVQDAMDSSRTPSSTSMRTSTKLSLSSETKMVERLTFAYAWVLACEFPQPMECPRLAPKTAATL